MGQTQGCCYISFYVQGDSSKIIQPKMATVLRLNNREIEKNLFLVTRSKAIF